MKGYNKIKDAMIAVLTASIYYNSCLTCNNEMIPVVVGTIGMFGCSYCMMRELDKLYVKRRKEMKDEHDVH